MCYTVVGILIRDEVEFDDQLLRLKHTPLGRACPSWWRRDNEADQTVTMRAFIPDKPDYKISLPRAFRCLVFCDLEI